MALKTSLRRLLMSIGWATGLTTTLAIPNEASAAPLDNRLVEEACQDALRQNTIEALEEFLLRYPNSNTTCTTLALDALNRFGGKGGDSDVQNSRGFYGG